MFKSILLFFIFWVCSGFARTHNIPETVRKEYAEKFGSPKQVVLPTAYCSGR